MYSFDKPNADCEELEETSVIRFRCNSLNHLLKMTKFSKKEMQMLYQGFKQECPSGSVTEDVFKGIFARFFPQGDSSQYAHLVFTKVTATAGQKGKLNFEQFVTMLSILSRGSRNEKLRWIFNLYDIRSCGYIGHEELGIVVNSIYSLLGDSTIPRIPVQDAAALRANDLFELMDANGDGVITFDEFCDWCQKDDIRLKNLQKFDTIFM